MTRANEIDRLNGGAGPIDSAQADTKSERVKERDRKRERAGNLKNIIICLLPTPKENEVCMMSPAVLPSNLTNQAFYDFPFCFLYSYLNEA